MILFDAIWPLTDSSNTACFIEAVCEFRTAAQLYFREETIR